MAKTPTLLILFSVVLVDLIGFGMLIPVQPFYAESMGASPAVVTLLGAAYSLMQFIFSPFWGQLSDRIGRRPVMISSILITGTGHLLFGLAPSLAILFLARSIAGFGAANIATAQAIISDSTDKDSRAKGMGIIGAAFGLGFIIGPAFGGWLGQYGPSVPPLAACGLSIVNAVAAAILLPETLKEASTSHRKLSQLPAAFRRLPESIGQSVTVTFMVITAFAMMEQCVGLFIQEIWIPPYSLTALKDGSRLTAYYLVVVGITATIIQGGAIGKLSKRFSEQKLMSHGVALIAVGLALIPIFGALGNYYLFLLTGSILAVGTGLLNPSISSFISKVSAPDQSGLNLSLNQSGAALGRILGPACAGVLFQMHSWLPFVIGSVIVLATLKFVPSKARA